jgi:hypothetical protein
MMTTVAYVDDECPQLGSNSQNVQVTEPVVANTVVASVKATDADTPSLTYSIEGGSDEFEVDSNGFVRTKRLVENPGTYALNVRISDGGACADIFATVSVQVNKVDLNTYLFSQSVYIKNVPENQVANSDIFALANTGALTASYALVTPSALFDDRWRV